MDNRIFLLMGGGGGGTEPVLDTLEVSANGTYTPPAGTDGYDEVIVDVEPALETKSITINGTYTPSTGKDGFSQVTVNVPSSQVSYNLSGNVYSRPLACYNKYAFKYLLENADSLNITEDDMQYYFNETDLTITPVLNDLTISSNTAIDGYYCFTRAKFGEYYPNLSNCSFNNCQYMFSYCFSNIPTQLTIYVGKSDTSFYYLFAYAQSTKTLPRIRKYNNIDKITPTNFAFVFCNAQRIRSADDVFLTSELSTDRATGSPTSYSRIFQCCYSLRTVPDFYKHICKYNAKYSEAYNSPYYSGFEECYVLDEITNIYPIGPNSSQNSNGLSGFIDKCNRLASFTFETDNGTPYTCNFKKATLDFSNYVGYAQSESNIINYNSGITIDKKVTSQSTYQQLKNDPDWYTLDINYSRYNHDSAVATINSLPDCSAVATGSSVNTIKFKGAAGTNTDGGAISNLTAEEIAVATAKGWTVSIL